MARKTTAKSETVKSTVAKTDTVKAEPAKAAPAKPEPSLPAAAKAPRAKSVKAKPAGNRSVFALQLVTGATVLTEAVGEGLVVAPKLKPGCTVAISYLKDVERPLAAATLHARIDGVALASKVLGHTDADGRFVRTPVALDLAPGARKLEYWFELQTADGQTLWDSNWGRNHWLEVEAAAVESAPVP